MAINPNFKHIKITRGQMQTTDMDYIPPRGVDVQTLARKVETNPNEAITEIRALIEKHPKQTALLYNILTVAYQHAKKSKKEFLEMTKEGYEKNPNYLFAKVAYGQACLQNKQRNKVVEIFNGKFDLQELYPKRRDFHVQEAVVFYGFLCQFAMSEKDTETAEQYYDPTNPQLKQLQQLLMVSRFPSWTRYAIIAGIAVLVLGVIYLLYLLFAWIF